MGFGNPNDEDNPSAPLKESDNLALTIRESGASGYGPISHGSNGPSADFMSFPNVSLPNSRLENVHGTYQSYTRESRTGNNLTGFMRSGIMQNTRMDCSLINLRGGLRNQDICDSGFQNPQSNMNFMPIQSSTAGGYQINGQEGEAKVHGNWSQITERSLSSSTSVSDSTKETGVSNDVKFSAFNPGKIDGSFLTLGTGNNAESRTKTKFSSREIASKLEDTISPQSSISYVPQTVTTFSSLNYNSVNEFPGFQSSGSGFPSPMCNLVGWTSSHNDDQTVQCGNVGLSSNSFQSPGMPETFKQYDFFEKNDRNLGFGGIANGRYSSLDSYNSHQSDPPPPSLPFSSTNTCFSYPGLTVLSELASESSKPVWTTTQSTTEQLQNYHTRNYRRDVFPSVASNCISLQGSSMTQDYLGQLIPCVEGLRTGAVESGPSSICVQPVGPISSTFEVNSAQPLGNSTFPEKIRPQIAEVCALKTATGGPFPRRLGVQFDDAPAPQCANQGVFPRVLAAQTRSYPQDSLLPQFNVQRPSFSTGQVLPIAVVDKAPQVSNVTVQPSLKRRASAPYPVPSWGHRRKLVHQPNSHHSRIYPQQGTPATCPLPASPIPSAAHIKWQGFDDPPQATGRKCLLCKRDLTFTPEGPMYQPSNPPAVAVLPCGHTFHDHCLQLITAEDQTKDPPCIPCAIGET